MNPAFFMAVLFSKFRIKVGHDPRDVKRISTTSVGTLRNDAKKSNPDLKNDVPVVKIISGKIVGGGFSKNP